MTALDTSAIEAFLYGEACLLDHGALAEWIELFADDAIYWVPSQRGPSDPLRQVSIVYEDRPALQRRVSRLLSGKEYAQQPRSVTCRALSNLVVAPAATCVAGETGAETGVEAVMVVYEKRPNTAMQVLPAHVSWRLREVDGELRIVSKRVLLLELDRYYENLTFIL